MADLWYYSHDQEKFGPCSGRRMKELAAEGGILPTDTVWKEGVERGVSASKVKNLFLPPPALDEAPAAGEPAAKDVRPPVVEPRSAEPAPAAPVPAPVEARTSAWHQPARKGRATAGRGVVLVSQDGVSVKYRKKCTTCGHLDSSWTTMPIRNGVMRGGFFCPKCRKHREVEVHGHLN